MSAGVAGVGLVVEPTLRRELAEELRRDGVRGVVEGVGLALGLYALFWIGNHLVRHVGFGESVDLVYGLGHGVSRVRIAALLLWVIGPAEEIVWRGLVQRQWARQEPRASMGWATALYAAVHVPSGNWVLVMAAAVAGMVWGGWYYVRRRLWANIVSHALWDVLVFVVWPLGA